MKKKILSCLLLLPAFALASCDQGIIPSSSSVAPSSGTSSVVTSSTSAPDSTVVAPSSSVVTPSSSVITPSSSVVIPTLSEAALASVQGSLSLAGGYDFVYVDDNSVETYTIDTIFTEETFYSIESYDGAIEYETGVFKLDNVAIEYYIDSNNEVASNYYGNDLNEDGEVTEDEAFTWDNFSNPFANLTVADFSYVSEGIFTLNSTDIDFISTVITGWDEVIEEFNITVSNDAVTSIEIVTAVAENTYMSIYNFDVTATGDAVTPLAKPVPYENTPAKAALADILTALDATSYTINVTDNFYGDIITYTNYYTAEAMYCTYSDEENSPYGYFEVANTLYCFDSNDGVLTLDTSTDLTGFGIEDVKPTLGDIPVLPLSDVGNGVFTSEGDAAYYVCANVDYSIAYNYDILSATISIVNDQLASIAVEYSYFGIADGTIMYEFTSIGSTVLPVDYSSLIPAV